MFANSNLQDLKDHLIATGLVARHYVQILFPEISQKFQDDILMAGLLHDIGKANSSFQNYIQKKIKDETIEEAPDKFNYHNEDSYLIATSMLKEANQIESATSTTSTNLIGWLIYHHHAPRRSKMGTEYKIKNLSEIKKGIKAADKKAIANLLTEMVKEFNLLKQKDTKILKSSSQPGSEVPNLVHFLTMYDSEKVKSKGAKEFHGLALRLKTCLITADRMVSQMTGAKLKEWLINKDFSVFNIDRPENVFPELEVVGDRDRLQDPLAKLCASSPVSILEAPPAFGKTRTSLRWLSYTSNSGSIIFVSPDNNKAQGIYDDLLSDLKDLGINKSLELFVGGETAASNTECESFTSDIIVTNIDSVLNPFVTHGKSPKIIDMYKNTMIFDEYHELLNASAMFCMIGSLMRGRTSSKAPTLLMSATPVEGIADHWFGSNGYNLVRHEAPTFNNKVGIKIVSSNIEALDFIGGKGCFRSNTVANTQSIAITNASDIIHGSYTKEDKVKNLKRMLQKHGKANWRENLNSMVSSSTIMQAGLNVSFASGVDTVVSPETTIQFMGRLGRFDESDVKLALFMSNSRGDQAVRQAISTNEIWSSWTGCLRHHLQNKEIMTKSEVLNLYRKFCKDNKELYLNWINKLQEDSIAEVMKFGWYNKAGAKKTNDNTAFSITMNLRGAGGYWVLVDGSDGKPVKMTAEGHTIDRLIKGIGMKGYERLLKYIDKNRDLLDSLGCKFPKGSRWAESLMKKAKNSDTPLLCLNEVWGESFGFYDSVYGLVTKETPMDLLGMSGGDADDEYDY